jgi:hypothetical protein
LVQLGVGKVLYPKQLSYDYSFNQLKLISNRFEWRVLFGMFLVIASIGSLFTRLRKDNMWILGQAFFWGPLLITGNFLFLVGTIFGERLWFWPSLGVVMMVVLAIRGAQKSGFARNYLAPTKYVGVPFGSYVHGRAVFAYPLHRIVFVIVLLLFAGRTFVRNLDWLSQDRLFIHDAVYAKDSVLAQSNAAAMYLLRKDFVKGKEYLERAEAIYPKYPELMNNWGMYYLWIGETVKAKKQFEKCLVEIPRYYLCESNLNLIK